jgi:hypothetical protein
VTLSVACLALLAAGFALAQNQPLDLSQQGEQEQTGQDRGFDDRKVHSQLGQTDDGPSILSRESGWTSQRSGKLIGFHFYGEITGIYDSGLTPVTAGAQPNGGNSASQGMEAGAGIIGSHAWRHEKFSVEYKGKYRQYANNPLFSGTDQFLSAAYSRLLHRHVTLDLKETLGTTTLANGEFAYLAATGTNMLAAPANELFDNRTNYLQSRVDLTWDATSRLSFGFGGQGFIVRRQSRALAGLSGYSARSDIAYRLTRHQTVSASYEYASFDFQRTFADAALQIAALGYSIGFSRNWDLSAQAGAIRTEARGLNQISIDPAIAAIIGQSSAVVSFSRTLYLPIAEARLTRRLNRSQFTLTYSKSVTPGNGVYLTSRQTAGTLGYSYTGYRRLAVRLNAGYGELSPLGQALGKYTNWQGGARMSYTLARDTFFELEYDYRHYTTQDSGFRMDSTRVSRGLAFSPGETPLAFW